MKAKKKVFKRVQQQNAVHNVSIHYLFQILEDSLISRSNLELPTKTSQVLYIVLINI